MKRMKTKANDHKDAAFSQRNTTMERLIYG